MEFVFLSRQDPFVERILSKSSYSAVYEFDEALGQMQKLKFEGSLYLLQRNVAPIFKLLILNRKSRDDFIDVISQDTSFSSQDNYVAYTTQLDDSFKLRRTLYFTRIEDKNKFIEEANKAIDLLKT